MQERINEHDRPHDRDIRPARTQTTAVFAVWVINDSPSNPRNGAVRNIARPGPEQGHFNTIFDLGYRNSRGLLKKRGILEVGEAQSRRKF